MTSTPSTRAGTTAHQTQHADRSIINSNRMLGNQVQIVRIKYSEVEYLDHRAIEEKHNGKLLTVKKKTSVRILIERR